MATSPSPNSAPSAVRPPPWSLFSIPSTSPDHLSLTPTSSPPPQSQSSRSRTKSPTTTNVPSMAPTTTPSADSTSPSPGSPPPPSQQPEASPPPPSAESPPPASPPPEDPPPVASSPPPPLPDPPKASPPPPTAPINSPPPPSQDPPATTPVTPSPNPPAASPPPPSSNPPSTSPPPQSDPPQVSPPPADQPPQDSPPSPSQPPRTPTTPPGSPPKDLAPSPGSAPPTNSTTPPSTFTPPPPLSPGSQPSPNSSATPVVPVSPPPPGVSPPSPTQLQVPPSGILAHNPHAPSSNVSTGVAVGIGIVLGFLLLGVIGVAAWCMNKKRKRVAGMPTSLSSSPNTDSSLLKAQRSPADTASRASEYVYSPSEAGGMGNSRPWFTYEALVDATNGFSEENLLGEGGFGRVYKGHLPDGQEVAVKQLKIGGGQGEREFKAEVEIISRIHHRHLVSLAGYCISDSRRLLVYEYVPNNTLHFHLHGPDRPVMTWETRVKIAAGAARGIAYLHEDCLPRIIHRDIKSANILLDKNFEARVSDFGLAKLAADANSHVTTRVMGTFGYMAPEYAQSGKLTEKSDVFSFGVVLLELITGRRPVDTSQPLGEESLAERARPKLSHALTTEEFGDLVDPRLEKNYVDSEMFRVIEAAAACVRHSATKRPSMGQVVRAFENMISADLSNGMRVGESAIYSSAEQSAEIRLFRRMAFGSQDYSTDLLSQGSWPNSG